MDYGAYVYLGLIRPTYRPELAMAGHYVEEIQASDLAGEGFFSYQINIW